MEQQRKPRYDADLSKIGTGQQVISSPNEGTPWQGDRLEKSFGF